MTRRLALSLLTVLALLWQGAASAAMGAAMALPPPAIEAAASDMPCHDMPGMEDMATSDHAAVDHQGQHDCCGSSGQCVCATACGASALAGTVFTLNLLPSPDVTARAIIAVLRDTTPPHPFRPPIVSAV